MSVNPHEGLLQEGTLFWEAECSSTMELARLGEARGDPTCSIYGTDNQTHGRGRFTDRVWLTPPRTSLTFTLLLRHTQIRSFPLSLGLGLGLALWLESCGLNPAIKWPNDVLINGRKVSGILIESTPRYSLAGIGINISQTDFPDHLSEKATSLSLEGITKESTPRDYLPKVLYFLQTAIDLDQPRMEIQKRLYRMGESVSVIEGTNMEPISGIVLGLGEGGGLILETAEGMKTVHSAEIKIGS